MPGRYDITLFTDQDLYLFNEGSHFRLYDKLGAHVIARDGIEGTYFAVWAPNAERVAVMGSDAIRPLVGRLDVHRVPLGAQPAGDARAGQPALPFQGRAVGNATCLHDLDRARAHDAARMAQRLPPRPAPTAR